MIYLLIGLLYLYLIGIVIICMTDSVTTKTELVITILYPVALPIALTLDIIRIINEKRKS